MKKEDKKEQLKDLKKSFNRYCEHHEGFISDIIYPIDFILPSEITLIDAENLFSEIHQSYTNRERGKAITKVRHDKMKAGITSFLEKFKWLKSSPEIKHNLNGFSHSEVIEIYEEALS